MTNGSGKPVRDQRGIDVARALGIDPETLGNYAARGLVPHDRTPGTSRGSQGRGHRRYNLEEVRRTLPLALVRKRSQRWAAAREAGEQQPAQSRFTVKQVLQVTCNDCGLQAVVSARALSSDKSEHEAAYHGGSTGMLKGEEA